MKNFFRNNKEDIIELVFIPIGIAFFGCLFTLIADMMGHNVQVYHYTNVLLFAVISCVIPIVGIYLLAMEDLFFEIEDQLEAIAKGETRIKIKDLRKLYNTYKLVSALSFGYNSISSDLKKKFENI